MMWAVDKIDEGIALLENTKTLEKKEVFTSLLPSSIHEGSILIYEDDNYFLCLSEEEKRRQEIRERFSRLRNKD